MFPRSVCVELKEVCKPRPKDKGVELLLSSSVDQVEEKPLISELGQNKANNETKGRNILLWLICVNQRWSGNSIRANTNKHN